MADELEGRLASKGTAERAERAGAGDFDSFAHKADRMLEEREFFVRKAIGWVLRDTGKRRPELVVGWLEPRAHLDCGAHHLRGGEAPGVG